MTDVATAVAADTSDAAVIATLTARLARLERHEAVQRAIAEAAARPAPVPTAPLPQTEPTQWGHAERHTWERLTLLASRGITVDLDTGGDVWLRSSSAPIPAELIHSLAPYHAALRTIYGTGIPGDWVAGVAAIAAVKPLPSADPGTWAAHKVAACHILRCSIIGDLYRADWSVTALLGVPARGVAGGGVSLLEAVARNSWVHGFVRTPDRHVFRDRVMLVDRSTGQTHEFRRPGKAVLAAYRPIWQLFDVMIPTPAVA